MGAGRRNLFSRAGGDSCGSHSLSHEQERTQTERVVESENLRSIHLSYSPTILGGEGIESPEPPCDGLAAD